MHEHGHYLYSLAGFYVITWLITTLICIATKDDDAFIKSVFLGILMFANSNDVFWLDPGNMAIFHIATILLMFISLGPTKHGLAFAIATYLMFISDMVWSAMPEMNLPENAWAFPYDIFYVQSIWNISVCILCLITGKGCYDTLKDRYESKQIKARIDELKGNKVQDDNIAEVENPISLGDPAVNHAG